MCISTVFRIRDRQFLIFMWGHNCNHFRQNFYFLIANLTIFLNKVTKKAYAFSDELPYQTKFWLITSVFQLANFCCIKFRLITNKFSVVCSLFVGKKLTSESFLFKFKDIYYLEQNFKMDLKIWLKLLRRLKIYI